VFHESSRATGNSRRTVTAGSITTASEEDLASARSGSMLLSEVSGDNGEVSIRNAFRGNVRSMVEKAAIVNGC
jgi:hypothetical protein